MNYQPGSPPLDFKTLPEYLWRELRRISEAMRDDAKSVFYRTSVETVTASAGISANWRLGRAMNVTRVSTSNTVTITGIDDKTPFHERVLVNIGTGVLVMKSEGTESSASLRLALAADWQISANAAAILWYDPVSSRHRGLSRT